MDVLVSLGTNASYLYSVISILHHHFQDHHMTGAYLPTDFFETSAMLITLVLCGKYLESAVSSAAGVWERGLSQGAPNGLHVRRQDSAPRYRLQIPPRRPRARRPRRS